MPVIPASGFKTREGISRVDPLNNWGDAGGVLERAAV